MFRAEVGDGSSAGGRAPLPANQFYAPDFIQAPPVPVGSADPHCALTSSKRQVHDPPDIAAPAAATDECTAQEQ